MSVEVLINDRFFDPDNCTPATERNAVRDYLVREFLVMANHNIKPEDKLKET